MNKQQLIESAKKLHEMKIQERLESPNQVILGSLLLYNNKNQVEWLAIATVQDKNLMNFLRNVRLTVQLKIELEGVVACVHCADVFVADVESEDLRKRITELSRTDPNYLETAERRGWVKNRSAIVTIGESAWATIRIQQRYDIVQDKVVAEDQQVFLDEPIQKTPFNGFSWPKVN